MFINFFGAARMVTGSNYLIETEKYKVLIDCGLFQGNDAIESMNKEAFPYSPEEIDFLILTHSHIDHSGRIPKLVKDGFKGRIFCTSPTFDLCEIMLLDSAYIQESDVKWENRRRERSGKELLEPLYTKDDVNHSLKFFETYFYNQLIKINDDISIRFRDAGHILGSAIVEIWIRDNGKEVKFVFSGDLGVKGRPILNNPDFIEEADYLIIESTYGDTVHESYEDGSRKLMDIINETALRGGSVIIPSFAVGRTQELIYKLNSYYEYNNVEEYMKIPIYVDSPMAIEATKAFQRNSSSFNDEARKLILSGDNPFEFENLRYIKSQEESITLNKFKFPKVIISSSGMATAGRIRHHLKHNLWNEKNSLVFVGYQAEGTLGRILLDGVKRVKLLGEEIDVKLEIHNLGGFSGHGDKKDIVGWIRNFKKKPKKIFISHGEFGPAKNLSDEIENIFGIETSIPKLGDRFQIKDDYISVSNKGISMPEVLKDDILKELSKVDMQYSAFKDRENDLLKEKILNKEYTNIKNSLIELQDRLMDLNMLLGK